MKTVRAKIMIAISDDGFWICDGSPSLKTSKARRKSIDEAVTGLGVLPPVKYYEVTVDVPVPAPERVTPLPARARRA